MILFKNDVYSARLVNGKYLMVDLTLNYLNRLRVSIGLLLVILVFNIADIYGDLLEGSSWTHILEESFMVIVFFAIIAVLIRKLAASTKSIQVLRDELENTRRLHAKQTKEMQDARQNYSEVIRKQFELWSLSKMEVETGFLLLKGLSLKEIAEIREVKEKTVRQQASNIYSKAGVAGRHEFAGWFFEELE